MLKRRVIATLLLKGPGLVKGERFQNDRRVGAVLPAIRVYETRQVDELILLDIAATPEGRGPDLATIEAVAADCFMPLTVGGGVRSLEDIDALLRAGADKVAIGTAALNNPGLIHAAARHFGSQCIVVAVDIKDGEIATHCGARTWPVAQTLPLNVTVPTVHAATMEHLGAGEILLTSVDRDGTMEGYDLDLIREVSDAVSIPVIASGGAGSYDDFARAFEAGAHAVAAGAVFQFTEATPLLAKQYLHEQGVPVRL